MVVFLGNGGSKILRMQSSIWICSSCGIMRISAGWICGFPWWGPIFGRGWRGWYVRMIRTLGSFCGIVIRMIVGSLIKNSDFMGFFCARGAKGQFSMSISKKNQSISNEQIAALWCNFLNICINVPFLYTISIKISINCRLHFPGLSYWSCQEYAALLRPERGDMTWLLKASQLVRENIRGSQKL